MQFFQKRYLAEDRALSKKITKPIGSVAFVTDGPHGDHEVDEKSCVAMLTAKCAANWFAKRDGADTVADWVRVANRRSYLEEGDLILSTRGTVGNCAVVVAECLPAIIDQDVARISLYAGCEFSPQYLLSYLNFDRTRPHPKVRIRNGAAGAPVGKSSGDPGAVHLGGVSTCSPEDRLSGAGAASPFDAVIRPG